MHDGEHKVEGSKSVECQTSIDKLDLSGDWDSREDLLGAHIDSKTHHRGKIQEKASDVKKVMTSR